MRPFLGVSYVPLSRDIASANGLNVYDGAWLYGTPDQPSVIPGSPAEKAGLKDGDVIVKVGNDAVTASSSLQSLVSKYKVGDKVTLTIVRDNKQQKITVTLGEAPAGQ